MILIYTYIYCSWSYLISNTPFRKVPLWSWTASASLRWVWGGLLWNTFLQMKPFKRWESRALADHKIINLLVSLESKIGTFISFCRWTTNIYRNTWNHEDFQEENLVLSKLELRKRKAWLFAFLCVLWACAFSLHLSHTPTIYLCQVVAALRNVGFDDQKLKSEFAPQEFENFSSIISYRSQEKYVKRAQNLLGILKPFISEGVSILHVDSKKTPFFF